MRTYHNIVDELHEHGFNAVTYAFHDSIGKFYEVIVVGGVREGVKKGIRWQSKVAFHENGLQTIPCLSTLILEAFTETYQLKWMNVFKFMTRKPHVPPLQAAKAATRSLLGLVAEEPDPTEAMQNLGMIEDYVQPQNGK